MNTPPPRPANAPWRLSTLRDEDWRLSASCREADAALFDERLLGESTEQQTARHNQAKAICAGCSVAASCLASYVRGEDEGIRAGKRLPPILSRPRTKGPAEIEHGTEKGAQQHRRRKEPVCQPCAEAEARAHQDRRRKREEAQAAKVARLERRAPCGTYEAYNQHRGRGEDVDLACREARNAHDRDAGAHRRERARKRRSA